MMKASKARKGNDAMGRRNSTRHGTLNRRVLAKAEMGSVLMVVIQVSHQDSSQVTFVPNDDVIEAISSD